MNGLTNLKLPFSLKVGLVQSAPTMLSIDFFQTGYHLDMRTDIQIKGVVAGTSLYCTLYRGDGANRATYTVFVWGFF